jgi:HK97 family phage major capsid protein
MPEVTIAELKKSHEELMTAFEEHKKTADARIAAVKAERGTADFDEKLEKLGEVMNHADRSRREWQKQQDALEAKRAADELAWKTLQAETDRKMEARINRAALGLGGGVIGEELGRSLVEQKAYDRFLRKGAEMLSADERKVLTVANDTTGGYLAPPTYEQSIVKAIVLVSPFRGIVTTQQIGTGELLQPKRTQTAAAQWVSEIGTRSETQNPAWGLMKIPVHELMAEARISMANLEDSAFNLEAEITQEFAEQFGVSEGAAVASGNGVNKPLGFLDANAAGPGVPIAYTISGSTATIAGASGVEGDGLINLFHAVKTGYAANGRWVLNRASLGKVRLLKDTNGRFLWDPGLGLGAAPPTILGAPYTEMPDMPNEGAGAFPIAFGDWKRAYKLVDRIDMSIVRDPYTIANVGQVKFFARRRTGGQVVLGEAIRLLKCST